MVQPAPACFNAMNRLMPVLRAETARRLIREGVQQERIAEHLGVSQAMVSKYLRHPPKQNPLGSARVLAELVDQSVKSALAEEAKGRVPAWCPICLTLGAKGISCALEPLRDVEECARRERVRATGSAEGVLENLRKAEEAIRGLPFGRLMPQVRANLAMALPQAHDSRDVAAFPGRFIEVKDEIRGAAPPEFGSSSHLAQLLLKVRRRHPGVSAILNARYGDDARRAARAAGFRLRFLKRNRHELVVALPRGEPVDLLVDPGAFGIEPALYVLGETALDVVAKVGQLLQHFNGRNPA